MEVNIIMAQRFILNGTSYHRKGAIKEIATEAISRGFKKAFVCSDPDLIKFGVTKKVPLKAVIRIRSFIRLKIRLCLTHSVFQRQEA